MRRELPVSKEILEELADKAAAQIDRLAPVAFDAALDELARYHRFLLSVNASQTPNDQPFNYAAVPGEAWRAPHHEWIGQYRRLFERAASRIGEDPDFIAKLAYVPLRLLPGRNDPEMPGQVVQAIIDLGRILIHQLEAWVTKRTVVETLPGTAASPRVALTGSDAKSYENLLPQIVGAWESLLQLAPSVYRWRDDRRGPDSERWDSLRASWPFLWQHLRNTAYMLAVSVWNEDEAGAALFRDALVRWPQTLSHQFNDPAHLLQRRLLFPDVVSLDLATAQERIKPILPQYLPSLGPDELFNATLNGAHDDVLLLTAALLLLWSMDQKQVSDIGAHTASTLLRRVLEDADDERRQPAQEKSFGSLAMDAIRFEIASDRGPGGTYGATLDGLVESLDNMTERRVVPGRSFTPSTLHDRGGLRTALLAVLLARAPEKDEALIKHIEDLAKDEHALPSGDHFLRDILHGLDCFLKLLETPPLKLQRGLSLLRADADFGQATARVQSIVSSIARAIEEERAVRLKEKPIDSKVIADLRDATERAMMNPPGGVPFFRGFSIEKTHARDDGEVFTLRFNDLNKAQFVDPPMESEALGFTEVFADSVTEQAGRWTWGLFTRQAREAVTVSARIEQPVFWERLKVLAADVGAEPLLIVSRGAEGRALREFIRQRREPPGPLRIERRVREDTGNSYIATIEGIDVYGADFEPGNAWLFSPYLLQSLRYAAMDEDNHILRATFQPGEDLKGPLIAEFKQDAVWAEWPIYEIEFEDPAEPE